LSRIADRGYTGYPAQRIGNGGIRQRSERTGVDDVGNAVTQSLCLDRIKNTAANADGYDLFDPIVAAILCQREIRHHLRARQGGCYRKRYRRTAYVQVEFVVARTRLRLAALFGNHIFPRYGC
jgi:hypothetical protein